MCNLHKKCAMNLLKKQICKKDNMWLANGNKMEYSIVRNQSYRIKSEKERYRPMGTKGQRMY